MGYYFKFYGMAIFENERFFCTMSFKIVTASFLTAGGLDLPVAWKNKSALQTHRCVYKSVDECRYLKSLQDHFRTFPLETKVIQIVNPT